MTRLFSGKPLSATKRSARSSPVYNQAIIADPLVFLRATRIFQPIMERVESDPRTRSTTDPSDMFLDARDRRYFSLVHMTDVGYREMAARIHETPVADAQADRPEPSEHKAVSDA